MDQIEEIRSKIDLVQFIGEFLPLKKAGRNFKGLCPFHTEKTPSFIVSPERQIWHCFGCGEGADVYGFLMKMERIEFGEALRILAKRTGVVLQSYLPTKSEAEKEKLYQVNHLASEFYHYLLLKHPVGKKALEYILGRGIAKDSLEKFKLGYAPAMWDGLQKFLVGKKNYAPEELEKAGLTIKSNRPQTGQNYYDRFRDRLMFPLSDHRGNVVGFAGRLPDPEVKDLPVSSQEPKYVNTPETPVYHKSDLLYPLEITKEDIKKENSVVIVEGELDAISSYQAGIKNVAAIKGSALTEPHLRLLKRFTENIFLSLDTDSAGDMASRRGIEIADRLGFNLKIVVLDKYKDPDEAAQKEPEYLKKQIKEAENIYDFYINSAFARLKGETTEEKKKIGQELIPVFAKIEDEIVKNVYIKKLADRLEVSEEAIVLQIGKITQKAPPGTKPSLVQPVAKQDGAVLEEYYLALLLQSKKVEVLLKKDEKQLFKNPVYLKLIDLLSSSLQEKKKFSSQFFYKALPAELKESFDKLYLIDFGEKIEDDSWLERETKKTKERLRQLRTRETLRMALEGLKKAEIEKNKKEEEKLQEKIKELTHLLGQSEKNSNL